MKLKEFIKKYWAVLSVFIMCAGVIFLFCTRKTGMFIDEIYTYGLSNSRFAPYLTDIKDGSMTDKIFTRDEVTEYLSVGENDRFAFSSVYYNQSRDVHPPLYYWLFNFVSSLFPGCFSKWIGIGINAVLFMLCLFIFYRLVMFLFGNVDTAAAGTAVMGICVLSLSMVMMIRMYTLLTLFTLLLMLITAHLIRTPDKRCLYLLLILTVFSGFMTQYYFAFYAFFLCLAYDIYALAKKHLKSALWFSVSALLGIALMIAVFPASLRQIFIGNGQVVGGSSVLEMIRNTSTYSERIDEFSKAFEKLKGMKWVLYGTTVISLLCCAGLRRAIKSKKICADSLLLIIPVIPAFLTVAIISPVTELRYVYNLIPAAALAVCFITDTSVKSVKELSARKPRISYLAGKLIVCLAAAAALWSAKSMPPDNLFTTHSGYDNLCGEHASSPCVYLTNNKFASVTQDLLQLVHFDSFFVTDRTNSGKMLDYIFDAEEVILYIDTDKYWSSGYDANEMLKSFSENTGLNKYEVFYDYRNDGMLGLSSVYLMSK